MALDDSFSKALLHMDGADASNTFTDESGKTWTASGDAQIDTAQSVFGGASGLFDGTGDYISTPDHDDFYLADLNWTFDFRIRFSDKDKSDFPAMVSQYADADNFFFIRRIKSDDTIVCRARTGGTEIFAFKFSFTPANDTWYHLMCARSGNSPLGSIDGVLQSITETTTISGKTIGNISADFLLASHAGFNRLAGWIDEFRFSKGIARWKYNFAVPSVPYATFGGQIIGGEDG